MHTTTSGNKKDVYLALVQEFLLTKLRSEARYRRALKMSGRFIGRVRALSPGEREYLEALVVLIREYEQTRQQTRLRKTKGIDVLQHLMGEHSMTQKALAKLIGVGESAVSMILAGKRDLTKTHISTLARHFGVGVVAFFD